MWLCEYIMTHLFISSNTGQLISSVLVLLWISFNGCFWCSLNTKTNHIPKPECVFLLPNCFPVFFPLNFGLWSNVPLGIFPVATYWSIYGYAQFMQLLLIFKPTSILWVYHFCKHNFVFKKWLLHSTCSLNYY